MAPAFNPSKQNHPQRPALDAIIAPDAKIEKLAGGFQFTEGPVWVREGGYLLFSDPNNNLIYRWSEDDGVSIYRTHSGYSGTDIGEYGQPGSNGLLSTRKAGSPSTNTAIAASRGWRKTASSLFSPIATRASGSTARTIWSIAPTARCTSPIRPSACRSSSTIRAKSCRSAACSA